MDVKSDSLLGAPNHGGVAVHIASSNPAVLQVSPDGATPGMAFIDVPVSAGRPRPSTVIQEVEGATGTVTITATASAVQPEVEMS